MSQKKDIRSFWYVFDFNQNLHIFFIFILLSIKLHISGVEFHEKHDLDSLRLIQHLSQEILDVFDFNQNLHIFFIFILLSIKMHISGVEFHEKYDLDSLRLIQHLSQEIIKIYRFIKFVNFFHNLVFPSILEENKYQI